LLENINRQWANTHQLMEQALGEKLDWWHRPQEQAFTSLTKEGQGGTTYLLSIRLAQVKIRKSKNCKTSGRLKQQTHNLIFQFASETWWPRDSMLGPPRPSVGSDTQPQCTLRHLMRPRPACACPAAAIHFRSCQRRWLQRASAAACSIVATSVALDADRRRAHVVNSLHATSSYSVVQADGGRNVRLHRVKRRGGVGGGGVGRGWGGWRREGRGSVRNAGGGGSGRTYERKRY
jgi:hypothetical protein